MAGLGLLAPHRDAEPDRLFDLVAGAVGVGPVGGHAERGHRLAAGRVAHLGVAAEVANENQLVEHGELLVRWGSFCRFRPGWPVLCLVPRRFF